MYIYMYTYIYVNLYPYYTHNTIICPYCTDIYIYTRYTACRSSSVPNFH